MKSKPGKRSLVESLALDFTKAFQATEVNGRLAVGDFSNEP